MSNKVVTMCDSSYFKYGKYFLETRNKIDAEFYLYGPDLTDKQKNILTKNGIIYKKVPKEIFNNKMQTLKFATLSDCITLNNRTNELITYVDFDVEFFKDWNKDILNTEFDLGITVRENMIKEDCKRAYANGGVIFARNTYDSLNILDFASKVIHEYGSPILPEYDEIFKTLEDKNRPEHKRHLRTNLRCWTDQVFLSAMVKNCIKNKSNKFHLGFYEHTIECFPCQNYNAIDMASDNLYIKHLKQEGRFKISGVKENLLRA